MRFSPVPPVFSFYKNSRRNFTVAVRGKKVKRKGEECWGAGVLGCWGYHLKSGRADMNIRPPRFFQEARSKRRG